MGKAVVSTPAGVNGLDLKSGHDIAIANNAALFAEAIERLSENPAERVAIEKNARMTAVAEFDWQAIGRNATATWR
jgi:glycosyltransferase involved in cell wall biosynthesis